MNERSHRISMEVEEPNIHLGRVILKIAVQLETDWDTAKQYEDVDDWIMSFEDGWTEALKHLALGILRAREHNASAHIINMERRLKDLYDLLSIEDDEEFERAIQEL